MVNIIKAEHQKAKRTMRKKFIWGFPLLTFVMAFIFTLLRLPKQLLQPQKRSLRRLISPM